VVERAAPDPAPDDAVASAEARDRTHELLFAALKDDAEALTILECMEAEIYLPADIANCLGWEVATVNRAKRRLARAAARALAKKEGRPS
jgi:DNA-directed RNA polymerase specialized sigma24 family protein